LQKNIYLTERYQCTYSTKSNKNIVQETWSRNSASLKTSKIRSSMVSQNKDYKSYVILREPFTDRTWLMPVYYCP